jgi:hypothetical protein
MKRTLGLLVVVMALTAGLSVEGSAAAPPKQQEPVAHMSCPVCVEVGGAIALRVAIGYAARALAAGAAAKVGVELAKQTEEVKRTRYRRTKNFLAWGRYYRGTGRAYLRTYRSFSRVVRRMARKLGGQFQPRLPGMLKGCLVGALASVAATAPHKSAEDAANKAKEGCIGGLVTKALLP